MEQFLEEISDIRFVDVDELFVKKTFIRKKYNEKDFSTKEVYKWYFYFQLCLIKNPLKQLLWSYINGENNITDLNIAYINFCNRRDGISIR